MSRAHNVKVINFPSGMSYKMAEKHDDLIKDKPDDLIIHSGTNKLANNVKLLNNGKKILKKVSANVSSTNLAFSSITVRKGKRNIKKSTADTSAPIKIFACKKYLIY